MKINPISSTIPFKNYLVIELKDKTCKNATTPMDKILRAACIDSKNLLVGEDVIILNSSEEVKDSLSLAHINFREIKNTF